jgi:hypothetical protein
MGAETGQYLEPLVRARAAYDQMMLAYRLAPHGPLKDACQEALHALADLVNEAQASAYATGSLSPAVSVGPAHQRPARPQPRPSTAMVVDTEPPPPQRGSSQRPPWYGAKRARVSTVLWLS